MLLKSIEARIWNSNQDKYYHKILHITNPRQDQNRNFRSG